ncbi:MAG: hypothetical protein ACLUOI_17315 [Eisenbergiella sp.]
MAKHLCPMRRHRLWMSSAKTEIGMVSTIPEGMKPGSDTANLSVIGYDREILFRTFLSKRSASAYHEGYDIAMRCNIVIFEEEGISFLKGDP